MKFTTGFLIICSVFLFSFSGTEGNMLTNQKEDCCKSASCAHRHKGDHNKPCGEGLCNNMLSCVRYALFIDTTFKSKTVPEMSKTVSFVHSNIGITSDYADDDWHPPRA